MEMRPSVIMFWLWWANVSLRGSRRCEASADIPPHSGALWFCKPDRDFGDASDVFFFFFPLNYQLKPQVDIKGYSKEISLQRRSGYNYLLRVCVFLLCIREAWCWCSAFKLPSFVFDLSELTTVPQVVSRHLKNVTDLRACSPSSVNTACFGGFCEAEPEISSLFALAKRQCWPIYRHAAPDASQSRAASVLPAGCFLQSLSSESIWRY